MDCIVIRHTIMHHAPLVKLFILGSRFHQSE